MKTRFTSVRSKILLITVLITLLIGLVVTAVSYFVMSAYLTDNLINNSKTEISYASLAINSNIDNVKSFIRACQINRTVQDYVRSDTMDATLRTAAHDFVEDTYKANSSLRKNLIRLAVVSKDRDDMVQNVESGFSSITINSEAIKELSYFEQLRSEQGNPSIGIVRDIFIQPRDIEMLPFVYPIYHPYRSDETGYIFAEMSTDVFTEVLPEYSKEENKDYYIRISDKLYHFENGELVKTSKNLSELTTTKSYYCFKAPLSVSDWELYECVDAIALKSQIIRYFSLATLLILIFSFIIFLVMYRFLSVNVSTPVKQLQQRIMKIEGGDFSRNPDTEWNNEFGEIGRTINDLTQNVNDLMNQRLADERQKKDYEYQILQSQINPHFLYNTLNSIKWMATIQNASGIAEMTTALSRLLKGISKGTSTIVTVDYELSLVKEYFTVQQYRYGGTINLDIDVNDDRILDASILRFSLQPIIENAIFHGIEPKGMVGNIKVHAYFTKEPSDNSDSSGSIESSNSPESSGSVGEFRIDVTDDGVGIEKEQLDKILSGDTSTSSSFFKEIGIANVHSRIKYEFGEEYGLSIESSVGEFTTVSILLPYKVLGNAKESHND